MVEVVIAIAVLAVSVVVIGYGLKESVDAQIKSRDSYVPQDEEDK